MVKPNASGNKGFTLMELLMAMSLLGIVIFGIYMLFSLVQRNYNATDTRSAINQQLNLANMQLNRDIRSASKPNRNTFSIKVGELSGEDAEEPAQDLHIYTFDETLHKYVRIQYRLDNGKLLRGYAVCETEKPPTGALYPEYGVITQWSELVNGVIDADGGMTTGFYDRTEPETNEKRQIEVVLIANSAARPLKKPIISDRTFTSRSIIYPE